VASPIEQMLYREMVASLPSRFQIWEVDQGAFENEDYEAIRQHGIETVLDDIIWMVRDYRVLSYRLDFALAFYGQADLMLALECDGHDFHDRTKQQAAYDRCRDRELFRNGIYTLRFTGSEIHHSVDRCVADVAGALEHLRLLNGRFHEGWMASEQRPPMELEKQRS
jgi:very-short-patch-repair endonuclease